jgi:hypothetical protein
MASNVLRSIWRQLTSRSKEKQNTIPGGTPPNGDKSPERVVSFPSRRQTEMNWLTRHKNVMSQYAGQWIVLEKDELIANSSDYAKARDAAVQKGIKRPFIIFVPLEEDGAFMGV